MEREDVIYLCAMSMFSILPLDGILAHFSLKGGIGPPPARPWAYAKQWLAVVAFIMLAALQTMKGYIPGQFMCLLNLFLRAVELSVTKPPRRRLVSIKSHEVAA
mmetsp:Transcript_85574/g.133758  ORF Transcript_85574/g.133758 Transcript_85574/m.133758 type:complete len:104 (+) Transcript_85574:108-419(+)